MHRAFFALLAPLILLSSALAQPAPTASAPPVTDAASPFPVTIRIDADKPIGAMKPIWRFFGADEPNYATMKDGQKLLGQIGELRAGAESEI